MPAQPCHHHHRPATATQKQQKPSQRGKEHKGQIFTQCRKFLGAVYGAALDQHAVKRIHQIVQRGDPIFRVQRAGRRRQQFFCLPGPQDQIDLPHQPIGMQILALGDLNRCQQRVELLVKIGAGLRQGWCLGFGVLAFWRIAKCCNLFAQRGNTGGVGVAFRIEHRAKIHNARPQGFKNRVTGRRVVHNRLGAGGNIVPPINGLNRFVLGEHRPDHKPQRQTKSGEKRARQLGHWSSKTPGMDCGARSSHPGTGKPFSRRNSGLNSLD